LTQEWVDALIDAGQGSEALPRIEENLGKSRWKSAWLIRRAKVRLAAGEANEAHEDLKLALDELNQRLTTSPTEALLLAERATVYDLLDNRADARRDYRAARDHGLADEWVRERIRALRDSPKDEE
jgi:tetratricopeptide (TPR) repeat protein